MMNKNEAPRPACCDTQHHGDAEQKQSLITENTRPDHQRAAPPTPSRTVVPCRRNDSNAEAEQAKFDAFMRPFWPRSQFRLRDDGAYANKAMRDRLDGWLTARSLPLGPLPKTGVRVADVTRAQRDLARLAASGDSDLAAACVRAQAVIEGLLSGLDVEQLS